MTEPSIHSMRFLSHIRQGADVVRLNEWIVVDMFDVPSVSMCVDCMAQITLRDSSSSFVRIWGSQSRPLYIDDEFAQWSHRQCTAVDMLVKLEEAQIRIVTCSIEDERYVFN